MLNIYRWNNLKNDSPLPTTRNEWLWEYGAFCCYNSTWFPCRLFGYTTTGEPAQAKPIHLATINRDVYPGTVNVTELDVLYSVFRSGMSLELYVTNALNRKKITEKMLDSAILRSLNTELISAPRRLIQQIKDAVNALSKGNIRVIDSAVDSDINVVNLPLTANILEKLWNSHDWAVQEISQLLGISFNPAHGKRERLLKDELTGDRDIIIINRDYVTSRLQISATNYGESVQHMSSFVDLVEREINSNEPKNTENNGEL